MANQSAEKPKRIKKTYEFPYAIAELIESHKYVTNGCEIDFVSAPKSAADVLTEGGI